MNYGWMTVVLCHSRRSVSVTPKYAGHSRHSSLLAECMVHMRNIYRRSCSRLFAQVGRWPAMHNVTGIRRDTYSVTAWDQSGKVMRADCYNVLEAFEY